MKKSWLPCQRQCGFPHSAAVTPPHQHVCRCMGYETLVDALETGDGTCDVGLGGVTVSTEKEAAGIIVSAAFALGARGKLKWQKPWVTYRAYC